MMRSLRKTRLRFALFAVSAALLCPTRAHAQREACRVQDVPFAALGKSSDMEEFSNILSATRLTNGTLRVFNRTEPMLRLFTEGGVFIRAAGRNGSGPGEFRTPLPPIEMPGDSMAVFDAATRRITVFSPNGSVSRTVTLSATASDEHGTPEWVDGMLAPGQWLVRYARRGQLPTGGSRPRIDLGVYTEKTDRARYLLSVPGDELFAIAAPGGGIRLATPLFSRQTFFRTVTGGVLVADSDNPFIELLDVTGRLVRRIPLPRGVAKPDDAALRRAIDSRIQNVGEDRKAAAAQRQRDMMSHDRPGSLGALLASGKIVWIKTAPVSPEDPEAWSAMTHRGEILCSLVMPRNAFVSSFAGPTVVAVSRDSLGTESIAVYRIEGMRKAP